MTVLTELAKDAQRLEYFVTIEGISWPVKWTDLSDGFSGIVWTTADLNGDLASILGCTVKGGLEPPSEISDSIDAKSATYSLGGMSFKIVDTDEWWLENYTPRKTDLAATYITAGVEYTTTTIDLNDGSSYSTASLAWIGGKELVRLGIKALIGGGPAARFTSSLRARRGTQRGSNLRRPADYHMGNWPENTTVGVVARSWWNRKVALWAHVPGEAVEDCHLLWLGKLRSVKSSAIGVRYDFSCVGDFLISFGETIKPKVWEVVSDKPYRHNMQVWDRPDSPDVIIGDLERTIWFDQPSGEGESYGQEDHGKYALALAYRYRCEPGGLAGAVAAWDFAGVQALDTSTDNDVAGSYVLIGEQVQWLQKKSTVSGNHKALQCPVVSPYWGPSIDSLGDGAIWDKGVFENNMTNVVTYKAQSKARFLLANCLLTPSYNSFHIQEEAGGGISKNPINILLYFLTSMDECFVRGDCVGGGTTSVIKFAAVPGGTDFWVGKWLFGMEDNHKWQCRKITANDGTDITVERAFVGAYAAAKEYQIRNTEFDTLPAGWGIGVDTDYLDVDSFLQLRDKYYPDACVSSFILGTADKVNIWEFLQENILKPYGILVYLDRTSRKIKARYMSSVPNADDIEDYVQISAQNIIDPGDINYDLTNPIGVIELKVRGNTSRIYRISSGKNVSGSRPGTAWVHAPAALFDGTEDTIILRTTESEASFDESDIAKISFSAMLDTKDTLESVIDHLIGICGAYLVPPPGWNPKLSPSLWSQLKPGVWTSTTWANYPVDPFDGTRGWSNVIGRLLSTSLPLDGKSLTCSAVIELHETFDRGRIAPAATVTAKNDDGTYDYFVVNDTDFTNDPDNDKDWWHFAAGDLIELRDKTGALKEAETIISFGSNHKTDPEEAADSRVNVVLAGIVAAIVAGDYITFQPWSGGATARMQTYSAYADAALTLAGGDGARKYQ